MSKSKWLFMVLAAVASSSCESVPLTAAPGTTLTLIANPTFVPANGGTSVVTAILVEPAGTFAPDGTVVFFFTNLGRIDPEAKTVNGVARANFVADSRSGTATITAISGGAAPATSTTTTTRPASGDIAGDENSDSVTITVGSALPALVLVTADPPRITSPRRATIVANVFDAVGNPVQNVPVIFSVSVPAGKPLEETLANGGSPRHTDSNGQAFDTLFTRAPIGGVQKSVIVTATTANNEPGSVTVFID